MNSASRNAATQLRLSSSLTRFQHSVKIRPRLSIHQIPASSLLQRNSFGSLAVEKPASIINMPVYSSLPQQVIAPLVHDLYHAQTGTWQYLIIDPSSNTGAIVDPVLDFDPSSRVISTETADSLLSLIKAKGYKIDRILETHVHADHLTAAYYLQVSLAQSQGSKPPIGIGKRIQQVQSLFGKKYGIEPEEHQGVFDVLFDDDETFHIGALEASAIHLPGHTPDHMGYKVGDNVFCGDSLFIADLGTARCDFPGGNARDLFRSAKKLLSMPDNVKIWTGHDYPSESRTMPKSWMSVEEHKNRNKHIMLDTTEEEFVAVRSGRDAGLKEPRLLHQSLQVNIRGGRLPKPNAAGQRLVHLPLVVNNIPNFN